MPGVYSKQSICPAHTEVYASWIVAQLAYTEVFQFEVQMCTIGSTVFDSIFNAIFQIA